MHPEEGREDGQLVLHGYAYAYDVVITNVTGPYEVILPVPLLRDGRVVPEIDFSSEPRMELTCATKGWGLRVVGDKDVAVHLEGTVEDLPESESTDRGIPFLSTLEGDVNFTGTSTWAEAWVYSNSTGLNVTLRVDVIMSRDWVTWYGKTTFRDGIGWVQRMDCVTLSGWSEHGLYIGITVIT